ncbi:class F sortase [Saccharomonospora xinjiangensis]|nr:Sortase family protein [Saccharomonospora xinjiangensis]
MTMTLSTRPPELRRSRGLAASVVVVVALATLATAVVTTTLLRSQADGQPGSPLSPGAERAAPHVIDSRTPPIAHDALPASPPSAIEIPALGISTEAVVGLGRTPGGVAEVPANAAAVGWLASTPTPGEAGASVLTGHTDFTHERGLFFALDTLRSGDTVRVTRADGRIAVFTVYRVEGLPGEYALDHATRDTAHPELRLLTAPGAVGQATRAETLIVSARLTSVIEKR